MRIPLMLSLALLGCIALSAQEHAWTTENNPQASAAYLLQIAYSQQGYMGAHVSMKHAGTTDVFVVDPGPIYHFGDVNISGVPPDEMALFMDDAPKSGDIYTAARVNDWVASVNKRLTTAAGRHVAVRQATRLDATTATVRVTVAFQ